jgi:hypothetical protein
LSIAVDAMPIDYLKLDDNKFRNPLLEAELAYPESSILADYTGSDVTVDEYPEANGCEKSSFDVPPYVDTLDESSAVAVVPEPERDLAWQTQLLHLENLLEESRKDNNKLCLRIEDYETRMLELEHDLLDDYEISLVTSSLPDADDRSLDHYEVSLLTSLPPDADDGLLDDYEISLVTSLPPDADDGLLDDYEISLVTSLPALLDDQLVSSPAATVPELEKDLALQLKESRDAVKKLSHRIEDYENRILELELELKASRDSTSVLITHNIGTQTWISEKKSVETQTDSTTQLPATVDVGVDPIPADGTLSSDLQCKMTGMMETTATECADGFGFELDLDVVDDYSNQSFPYNIPEWDPLPVVLPERDQLLEDDLPQLVNSLKNPPDVEAPAQQQTTACQSSWADQPVDQDLPPEEVDMPSAPSVCSMSQAQTFAYADFRYRNKPIEGYSVFPTTEDEKSAKHKTSIPIVLKDIFPVSDPGPKTTAPPKRTDTFRIRNNVVHTKHGYKDIIANIGTENCGRILGKGRRNIEDLRKRFGVCINLSQPDEEGLVIVTVTGGTADDRNAAVQELVGQLPVKVDVIFAFGSLSQVERNLSCHSFPFVRIAYDKKICGYVFSGKLKECREAFEKLKVRV